jgi:hypothetical protein
MRRQSSELLADHEGLELHGAPRPEILSGKWKFPEAQAVN